MKTIMARQKVRSVMEEPSEIVIDNPSDFLSLLARRQDFCNVADERDQDDTKKSSRTPSWNATGSTTPTKNSLMKTIANVLAAKYPTST
jgi:hypothetical protein